MRSPQRGGLTPEQKVLHGQFHPCTVRTTPTFAFGHGLSYSQFAWTEPWVAETETTTDGDVRMGVTVQNVGETAGSEVIQLYLTDPIASVVQPLKRLIGFRKVALAPGESVRVAVTVPLDLASFTGVDGTPILEPGHLEFSLARSSTDVASSFTVTVHGATRPVDHSRSFHPRWEQDFHPGWKRDEPATVP